MLPKIDAENLLLEEDTLVGQQEMQAATERLAEGLGPLRVGLNREQAKKIFKKARRIQSPRVFSVLYKFNLEHEDLECLWSAEKDKDRLDFEELSAFAEYNDDTLDESISDKQDLKHKTEYGDTLLMFAAFIGCVQLVQDILERDASLIDDQNAAGYTALMLGSLKGHDHVVQALLEQSADVNLKNKQGKTAADLAEERELRPSTFNDKYDQVLTLLIAEDCENFTPTFNLLRRAFKYSDKKVIHRILLKDPTLLLQECEQSDILGEDKANAEKQLLIEEFWESIKNDYDFFSSDDRSEVDAFLRYVLGLHQERIQEGSMPAKMKAKYYILVEQYLKMKSAVDILELREQQQFFEFIENIKMNRLRQDDPILPHHLCPYRNQFNSRKAFVKAMQKNTSLRELILNYDNGVEDAVEIIRYNRTIHTLEIRSLCEPGKDQMENLLRSIEGSVIKNISCFNVLEERSLMLLLANKSIHEIRYVACMRWIKENNEALISNQSLKILSIGIAYGGLSELLNALINQKSLETVSIKILSSVYIPSTDLAALIQLIENNHSIKHLNLDFDFSQINRYNTEKDYLEDLSRFFQAVRKNTSLLSLSMHCATYYDYSILDNDLPDIDACAELTNILTLVRDALVDNYTLISFIQSQSAEHMQHSAALNDADGSLNDAGGCKVRKVVLEIINLQFRNSRLKPILDIISAAELAPEISDFEDPKETRKNLIQQSYEIAKNIYHETRMDDIFFHLAKILATRFPGNPEFSYQALSSIPESQPAKRLEAQIILSCKDGTGIPSEFATIREPAKNLILLLQKNRLERCSLSLEEPDLITSEDAFKEEMAHLFEAQKLSKIKPASEISPQRRRGLMSPKAAESENSLNQRIDQVANAYLGSGHSRMQNIQADAPTITTLLREIRGYGNRLKEIRKKIGSDTEKLGLATEKPGQDTEKPGAGSAKPASDTERPGSDTAKQNSQAKRNAEVDIDTLHQESCTEGQKRSKKHRSI